MSLRLDELGDEAAAGRVLERVEHAEDERQRPHDRRRCPARRGRRAPSTSACTASSACVTIAIVPLVAAVGDGAGPRPEQQHRQELQGDGDAEVGRLAGQVGRRAATSPSAAATSRRSRPAARRSRSGRCGAAAAERLPWRRGATSSREPRVGQPAGCRSTARWRRPASAARERSLGASEAVSQSSLRAEMKTSPGTSTRPIDFIFFLPSFCFSSSLRLRVMSPP